ncbi:SAM-dependent methyltransferase [Pseudonocardiaceae bacterium YIM PH 21723]|nr:SAM-dependent methyltransferase [Pseudonocardiaceae bacterium YIM PH 21723]
MSAVRRWREALRAWEIPDEVLSRAPRSPWVLPRQVFVRRADAQLADPIGATYRRAIAELSVPGTVLDVGAAAGATSLPLLAAGQVTGLTVVDADAELTEACVARATRLGVPVDRLPGRWPEVAARAPVADVVLCGNVLYNVADLEPFVAALTTHARRAVIVETAARHPLTELNPLWQRFHGITRPAGPDIEELLAALGELGVYPEVEAWRRPPEPEYATFAELVEVTRTRLCLPSTVDPEVDRALRELGHSPDCPPDLGSSGRDLVTLSWAGSG